MQFSLASNLQQSPAAGITGVRRRVGPTPCLLLSFSRTFSGTVSSKLSLGKERHPRKSGGGEQLYLCSQPSQALLCLSRRHKGGPEARGKAWWFC